MEYKAQLVIRSREREGVELIEQIKELASESKRTYSDMALELLKRGVAHQTGAVPSASQQPAPSAKSKSKPKKKRSSRSRSTTKSKSSSSKSAPITAKLIKKIAKKCAAQIENEDTQAATQTLADFFAKAGPVQGGKIKTALEKSMEKSDYDLLLKNLRKTQEYRTYRQRVILQR